MLDSPIAHVEIQVHTQETLAGVADLEVLILELVAVDGLATSACEENYYPETQFKKGNCTNRHRE